MLKMPIFHASVHTHDAESDTSMNINLKYNTCIIKLYRYHEQAVHLIFHHIWTSLYGPVLCHDIFWYLRNWLHGYTKMSLDDNCRKSGQRNLIFCLLLPFGVLLCMPGQYWAFPPLAVITATGRRGMLATRRCRHSMELLAVWRSCRLLHLGDVEMLKEIKDYPSSVKGGVIILVAGVALKCYLANGNKAFHKMPPYSSPVRYLSGAQEAISQHCESSQDVYWTTTSLDPYSLAPLLEALTR